MIICVLIIFDIFFCMVLKLHLLLLHFIYSKTFPNVMFSAKINLTHCFTNA